MPELPDVTVYVERLRALLGGREIRGVRVIGPSLLRSVDPPLERVAGRRVTGVRRIGKRIVFDLEGDLHLVLHLMVAGRLRWRRSGQKGPGRAALARFDFPHGTLWLTEAGRRKRATLYLVKGESSVASHDPGGLEVLEASRENFVEALRRENRTLKRALTDARLVSGIGNAYSDEILHRARLSPVRRTHQLDEAEWERLHRAVRDVLESWTDRLRAEAGDALPEKVTAFRPGMAVHGRAGEPCPDCGAPVQRIVYAENETNYCPRCQTGGRILADRALSRLLRGDWPRRLEDLERRRGPKTEG